MDARQRDTYDAAQIGVAIFIVNGNGRIALGRRADDTWCIQGGRLEPGETKWAAALREGTEESGLELELIAYLGLTCDYLPDGLINVPWETHFYLARAVDGEFTTKEPDKHADVHWVELSDLTSYELFAPLKSFIAVHGLTMVRAQAVVV